MSLNTEAEVKNADIAQELRLRRLWKADLESDYRGRIQDLLSHVESLTREVIAERLQAHTKSIRELHDSFRKNLEDEVAAIVVKILAEYKVKGGDGKPIEF
jgi:hypothetical protein